VQDINSTSIGVEVFREQGDDARYPADQLFSLISLCQDIIGRHEIRADRVIAHQEIAPTRKHDPGPNFPWRELADQGIGIWPERAVDVLDENPMDLMVEFGYHPDIHHDAEYRNACITAFQSRFSNGDHATGVLSEGDRLKLSNLITQCRELRPAASELQDH
jgi:N-acetyl-anhydromuramyl-L-alanine amidase AmpD